MFVGVVVFYKNFYFLIEVLFIIKKIYFDVEVYIYGNIELWGK